MLTFQKFKSNRYFCEQAQVFDSEFVTKQDIEVAGEKALVCLYNGNSEYFPSPQIALRFWIASTS